MKIADLSRRVKDVSDNMKTLRINGTTRIDWNCLSSEERVLFEKVLQIQGEYLPHLPPDDVLLENQDLFIKGIELLTRRAIDLFKEATKAYCLVNSVSDNEAFFESVFSLRIYWFLHEMSRHFERDRKEEELFKKYENDEDFEHAYDEWQVSLEDKTALWSPESFERFVQPLFNSRNKSSRGKKRGSK